jgi:hypothetical protein
MPRSDARNQKNISKTRTVSRMRCSEAETPSQYTPLPDTHAIRGCCSHGALEYATLGPAEGAEEGSEGRLLKESSHHPTYACIQYFNNFLCHDLPQILIQILSQIFCRLVSPPSTWKKHFVIVPSASRDGEPPTRIDQRKARKAQKAQNTRFGTATLAHRNVARRRDPPPPSENPTPTASHNRPEKPPLGENSFPSGPSRAGQLRLPGRTSGRPTHTVASTSSAGIPTTSAHIPQHGRRWSLLCRLCLANRIGRVEWTWRRTRTYILYCT